MAEKHTWQAILFDFDGVIAASHEVKVQAFATLFADHGPTVQAAVVRYHLDNGGVPRHLKLRHCCERIAGLTVDDRELDELSQRFSNLVFAGVVAAPLLPGVAETLKHLVEAGTPAFVVSGTPHEEMNRVAERKGLDHYFSEIHGSPRAKIDIIHEILARHALVPNRCLFIGDAVADYQAARDAGLPFLGIVSAGAPSPFPEGTATSARIFLPPAPGSPPVGSGRP
jgi:HAD superfamily hydrolase (TIGR01549 family)